MENYFIEKVNSLNGYAVADVLSKWLNACDLKIIEENNHYNIMYKNEFDETLVCSCSSVNEILEEVSNYIESCIKQNYISYIKPLKDDLAIITREKL